MKVKQIVGEHKKGFRAKKYARKPKSYIEPVKPTGPQSPEDQRKQQIKEAPGDSELLNQVSSLQQSNPQFAAEMKARNLALIRGMGPEAQKRNAEVMQQLRLLVQKYSGTPAQETLGQDVQIKPQTGAQEIDVNGKPIATATDIATANNIAQLVKTGKVAMNPQGTTTQPNQGTMEDIETIRKLSGI